MDLQNQQLAQLADWLTKTEERTKTIDSEPLGPDLDDLKRQVEEHKVCYGLLPKNKFSFGHFKTLLLPLEHNELIWNHGLILMVLYNEQAFVVLFYYNSHFYPDLKKKNKTSFFKYQQCTRPCEVAVTSFHYTVQ